MANQSPIAVGDVLYLHDKDTGFSNKDKWRWCIVTAVTGTHVRVAGRSASRTDGYPLPKEAVAEFDKDGHVPGPPQRVPLAVAMKARRVGPLPSPYLEQLLFFMNEDLL